MNIAGSFRNTALIRAAIHGDVETISALIQAGADVNRSGKNGTAALKEGADLGSLECIDLLLSSGSDFI